MLLPDTRLDVPRLTHFSFFSSLFFFTFSVFVLLSSPNVLTVFKVFLHMLSLWFPVGITGRLSRRHSEKRDPLSNKRSTRAAAVRAHGVRDPIKGSERLSTREDF